MQIKKPNELTQEERASIVEFLHTHPLGVLATVDEDGNPHASPIYFSVDGDMNISFTTKLETQKSKNIARNKMVMLVAYDSENQAAVQAKGPAVEVKDPAKRLEIYHGTLRGAKITGEDNVPPIAKINAGPFAAYTITPEDIWLSEYGWGDSFANALKEISQHTDDDTMEDSAHE